MLSSIKTKTMFTVLSLVFLVSCGGSTPQVVKDISVKPYYEESDLRAEISTQMDLGNFMLPAVGLPVLHPKTGEEIGYVALQTLFDGKSQIMIDLNLSTLLKIQSQSARLPNGRLVPLVGTNEAIEVPLGSGNAKVYVTFGQGVVAVGAAITISSFDGIGSKVGAANLFPMFNIKGVVGAAGIFTSSDKGESGVAIIADVSSLMTDGMLADIRGDADVELDFESDLETASKKSKLQYEIFKSNRSAGKKGGQTVQLAK